MDLTSLAWRWQLVAGVLGALAAAGWVAWADRAAARAHVEHERGRVEAIACSAAVALDGDVLAGTVQTPEAWSELEELVDQLAATQALSGSLRVLTPEGGGGALRVVASSEAEDGTLPQRRSPEVAEVLAGVRGTYTEQHDDRLTTWVAAADTFGEVAGLVRAEGTLTRSRVDRAITLGLHGLLALALWFGLWKAAGAFARRHAAVLTALAQGHLDGARGRFAPRELRALADTLERLGGVAEQDEPRADEPTVARTQVAEQESTWGPDEEATEIGFSPRELVERVLAPFCAQAQRRGLALHVALGTHVPARVTGDAKGVARALEVLLRQALANTRTGVVRVRVSRVQGTDLLRFETSDTGDGVPWSDQPALAESLAAVDDDAEQPLNGLPLAAHLARRLGGELEFESQPGCGSRFWYTARCAAAEGASAAALPTRSATGADAPESPSSFVGPLAPGPIPDAA